MVRALELLKFRNNERCIFFCRSYLHRTPFGHPFHPHPSVSYRLDRFEMKFVITREQRDLLMPILMPHLRADVNAGDDAFYPIISLYYDNPDRDCYWEKIRAAIWAL